MLIVASLALLVLANDRLLNHAVEDDAWGRSDGLVLLLLFSIFLYYTAREAMSAGKQDPFVEEVQEEADRQTAAEPAKPLWMLLAMTIAGLVGLSLGAQWTVDFAVAIAQTLGVSQSVIGLTIVSFGTTLPELTTCIIAARRGNADIALGNVVGSNILNLLGIGGLVSTIRPVPIPQGGQQDLLFLAVLTVVLLPIAIRSGRVITRGEGAVLLTAFAGYMGWRIAGI
jgi:cation:H+ antiporter